MINRRDCAYLIDDDEGFREGLTDYLRSRGIPVASFGSVNEYLSFERDDDAACLILDIELPGISGIEYQQQLSESLHPPVIFITAHGSIPLSVRAIKAGAIEFLTKPVDLATLLSTIRTAFQTDCKNRLQKSGIDALRARLATLTPREREVLPLVVRGLLNKQSAASLGIREVTLQLHRRHIMKKLAAPSLAELVRIAERLNI
ncbi:MAG TPA: response regulator [Steroidobacteraceae bacterium]|nr:response regulator [Steroidobacteraceae bacterium]